MEHAIQNTPEFPPELFTAAEVEKIESYFAPRFAKIQAKHRAELAVLERQLAEATAKQQVVA
jgi:hypothetical protein